MSAATAAVSVPLFKRRWFKILAALLILLVILLGVLVAAAPSIAGGMAPAIIESSAKDAITGSVKVSSVSLSWGGPQLIGPVDVKDPSGTTVATVNLKASKGLWALATGGGQGDLGVFTVDGKVDLVRNADGSTNLEKAIAPSPTAKARPALTSSVPKSSLPNVTAKVDLTDLDITYKELAASGGGVAQEASITNLKGAIDVATANGVSAKVKLDGAVAGAAGGAAQSSPGALVIDATIDNVTDANGNPTLDKMTVNATVDATKLPVALIDAIANMGGVLTQALGQELAIKINAKGTTVAGDASIIITSANVTGDLALTATAGRLTTKAPGSFKVKSTDFINSSAFSTKYPQLKDALTKAGMTIQSWPGIEAKIAQLNVPLPGAGGAAAMDMRGAAADITLTTGGLRGTLASQTEGGATPAAPQALSVAPLVASVKSADLAQGATITADTSASLGGASAGVIKVNVQANDLLDAQGKLGALAGKVGNITADIAATGISTALARPFLVNSPLDAQADIGPTLDVSVKAQTKVDSAAAGGAAPIDADIVVKSQNINLTAPVRWASSTLTGRGETKLTVGASAPIVQRFLAKSAEPGKPASLTVGGTGGVAVTINDLSVPMQNGLDYAGLTAKVRTEIRTLSAMLAGDPAKPAAQPVMIDSFVSDLTVTKGQPASIKLDGRMTHEGKPFTLTGDVALPGLMETLADPKRGPLALTPGMEKFRLHGDIALKGVPGTLAKAVIPPSPAVAAGQMDTGAIVQALVNDLVGQSLETSVKFGGAAGSQTLDVLVTGAGLKSNVGVDVSSKELKVRQLTAEATVRPETAKRIAEATGTAADKIASVNMRGPATLALAVDPITIPVDTAGGKITPQTGKIGAPIKATIGLREPLIVTGLELKPGQVISGGISGLQAVATVPTSAALDGANSKEPVNLTVDGQLVLDDGKPVATFGVRGSYIPSSKTIDATAGLTKIDTAGVDRLIGKPNLLAGALGAAADITVTAKGAGDNVNLTAGINSPRLKGADLSVKQSADRISITSGSGGPVKLDWTIDPAFASQYVFAKTDEQGRTTPGSMRLTAPAQASLTINTLTIAASKPETAVLRGDSVGPLKPGIFTADIAVSVPQLAVEVEQAAAQAGGAPTKTPATLDNVTATMKSTPQGSILINASIGAVGAAGGNSTQPVTAVLVINEAVKPNGQIDADRAKLTADISAMKFPTAIVDGIAGRNGQLVKTLGDTIDLTIKTQDIGYKSGDLAVNVSAKRAGTTTETLSVRLNAPVVPGQLATTAGTIDFGRAKTPPGIDIKLYEYKYELDTEIMKAFPLFASISKGRTPLTPAAPAGAAPAKTQPGQQPAAAPAANPNAGTGPSTVISTDLRFPIPETGGANRNDELNGNIAVDLGRIDYTFKKQLGEFLDSTVFTAPNAEQRPVQPFNIRIDRGVITYDKFEVPIRNYDIMTKGTVNLNTRQMSVTIFIPTVALAPSFAESINKQAGSFLRSAAPDLLTKGLMFPITVSGPIDDPTYAPDFDAFFKNLGEQFLKQPENIIKGIGDLFNKPKKK